MRYHEITNLFSVGNEIIHLVITRYEPLSQDHRIITEKLKVSVWFGITQTTRSHTSLCKAEVMSGNQASCSQKHLCCPLNLPVFAPLPTTWLMFYFLLLLLSPLDGHLDTSVFLFLVALPGMKLLLKLEEQLFLLGWTPSYQASLADGTWMLYHVELPTDTHAPWNEKCPSWSPFSETWIQRQGEMQKSIVFFQTTLITICWKVISELYISLNIHNSLALL